MTGIMNQAPDGTRGVMTAHRGWLVAYFFMGK
jgi:hypothetical protein